MSKKSDTKQVTTPGYVDRKFNLIIRCENCFGTSEYEESKFFYQTPTNFTGQRYTKCVVHCTMCEHKIHIDDSSIPNIVMERICRDSKKLLVTCPTCNTQSSPKDIEKIRVRDTLLGFCYSEYNVYIIRCSSCKDDFHISSSDIPSEMLKLKKVY